MADTFTQDFSAARLKVLSPAAWDLLIRTLDIRLKDVEGKSASFDAAVAQLQSIGLARINEALLPAFQELAGLTQLGAIFTATSATTLNVSQGAKQLTVDAADRDRFAPTAYLALRTAADPNVVMTGANGGYHRPTGTLTIDVDQARGAGEFAAWIISPAAAPNFDGYSRADIDEAVDDPAQLVAAETSARGAAIAAEALVRNNAITQALDGLIAAAPGALDTLNELAAALGNDANFASTVTAALAGKASLTGNETIAGVKTFSSHPVGPGGSPAGDNDLVGKKYVDDAIAALGPDWVLLAGPVTPSGAAVDFTDIPQSYRDLAIIFAGVSCSHSSTSFLKLRHSGDAGGSPAFFSGIDGTYYEISDAGRLDGILMASSDASARLYSGRIIIDDYSNVHGLQTVRTASYRDDTSAEADAYALWVLRKRQTAVKALRLHWSAGNYDAGTVSLYARK